jgi:hypothetical protein
LRSAPHRWKEANLSNDSSGKNMREKPKAAPKGATPKPNDPEQSKRFIETARETKVDETGEAFRRIFDKIVPPKSSAPKSGSRGEP